MRINRQLLVPLIKVFLLASAFLSCLLLFCLPQYRPVPLHQRVTPNANYSDVNKPLGVTSALMEKTTVALEEEKQLGLVEGPDGQVWLAGDGIAAVEGEELDGLLANRTALEAALLRT